MAQAVCYLDTTPEARPTMSTLKAYEGFLRVVELGSVSAASRALGVPRPTVSRRLAELEARLGVRLVHRGAGGVLPTRAGDALVRHLRPLLRSLGEVEARVRQLDDVPRGLLRVTASPYITDRLAPLVDTFLQRCPEVDLELLSTNRFVDLRAEQFDVGVRGGELRDPALVARRLARLEVVAVAAPAYLARSPPLTGVPDLQAHRCLLSYGQDGRPRARWPLRDGGRVGVQGPLATNDRGLLLRLAVAGRGIALLTHRAVAEPLSTGALVPVLPEWVGTSTTLSVVYAERERVPPKVRVFVDALVDHFAD